MSQIYSKIKEDIVTAMKSGNKNITNTLRLLVDTIQKKAMAKKININDITDELVIDCVNSSIKQREESITEFTKGNRQDLVQKELQEVIIIKYYQPKQMSTEELTSIIQSIISVAKAKSPSVVTLGSIMKDVMSELKGKADGKKINEIVKQLMS